MVVFPTPDEEVITASWDKLRQSGTANIKAGTHTYSFAVNDTSELTIKDEAGNTYPFYFEMWFSLAVQHGDNLVLLDL
jgi:hypothetical protein